MFFSIHSDFFCKKNPCCLVQASNCSKQRQVLLPEKQHGVRRANHYPFLVLLEKRGRNQRTNRMYHQIEIRSERKIMENALSVPPSSNRRLPRYRRPPVAATYAGGPPGGRRRRPRARPEATATRLTAPCHYLMIVPV